jgi:chromosome partitioning protein
VKPIILHSKGGCGKTTTTSELAGAFAVRGLRVLVVDADPQGALTEPETTPSAIPQGAPAVSSTGGEDEDEDGDEDGEKKQPC